MLDVHVKTRSSPPGENQPLLRVHVTGCFSIKDRARKRTVKRFLHSRPTTVVPTLRPPHMRNEVVGYSVLVANPHKCLIFQAASRCFASTQHPSRVRLLNNTVDVQTQLKVRFPPHHGRSCLCRQWCISTLRSDGQKLRADDGERNNSFCPFSPPPSLLLSLHLLF